MVKFSVTQPSLSVDPKRVWQRMGHRDPAQVKPRVKKAFEAIYPQALALLRPRVAYRVLELTDIDVQTHTLNTPEAHFSSSDLIRLFGHAKQLAAFVVSVGAELEAEVKRRSENNEDLLNAYFLDVVASEALMRLIRDLRTCIQNDLDTQEEATVVTRYWYCPGYGNWDVRDQVQLFVALQNEAEQVGVRLNNHCVMIPRKSYSGLFGIGPALAQDPWNSDIAWVAR